MDSNVGARKRFRKQSRGLALAGFEAPIRLVDDVGAAAAANDTAIAMPALQRLQGITNFHRARRLVLQSVNIGRFLEKPRVPYGESGSKSSLRYLCARGWLGANVSPK